jgi:hypothetical protein
MSQTSSDQNDVGVFENHSFFWKSQLTKERKQEISDWIGSLTKAQRKMLDDLLRDTREEARWDEIPD